MKTKRKYPDRPRYQHCILQCADGTKITAWLPSHAVKLDTFLPVDEQGRHWRIKAAGLPCPKHVAIKYEQVKHLLTDATPSDSAPIILASREALLAAALPYVFEGTSCAGEATFGQVCYHVASEHAYTNFGLAALRIFFNNRIMAMPNDV